MNMRLKHSAPSIYHENFRANCIFFNKGYIQIRNNIEKSYQHISTNECFLFRLFFINGQPPKRFSCQAWLTICGMVCHYLQHGMTVLLNAFLSKNSLRLDQSSGVNSIFHQNHFLISYYLSLQTNMVETSLSSLTTVVLAVISRFR